MTTQMNKVLSNTAQTEKAVGKNQVKNNAGGYVFAVSDRTRIERFLILGAESNFYVNARDLTRENMDFVISQVKTNESLVADVIASVDADNRAAKKDYTIFALAVLFQFGTDKARARELFTQVIRTSTHLFMFLGFVKELGGMGRSKRNAVKAWYESKSDDALAYQMVKYRQRNGWTHKDALRVSHAVPSAANAAFALGRVNDVDDKDVPAIIAGFLKMQDATTVADVLDVLSEYPMLPWETIGTEFLNSVEVQRALFDNGSLRGTALVRGITRMARLGMFADMDFATAVADRIVADVDSSGIHPMGYLNALVTHREGQVAHNSAYSWNVSRNKNWDTSEIVADALEEAFYASFKTVAPSGKRFYLGIDVSGSMSVEVAGSTSLTSAQVSAAMAMTIARTEKKYVMRGFSSTMVDLGITARDSLDSALNKVQSRNFGSTDASVAMRDALDKGIEVDTFVIITDNDTYAGRVHPYKALQEYRRKTGINAQLIVLGTAATDFTIADPSDAGMLDVVGFDPSVPRVVSDFAAGRI